MRKKSDKGVVIILDSRVVKKSYGCIFIQSLPESKRVISDNVSILSEIQRFMLELEQEKEHI